MLEFIIAFIVIFCVYLFVFHEKEDKSYSPTPQSPRRETAQKSSLGKMTNTKKGEWVRSKAEAVIADALFENNIEYIYEKPLVLKGKVVAKPDFYLVKSSTYIEYFWLMQSQSYKENAQFKLQQAYNYGYKLYWMYPHNITAQTKGGKNYYCEKKVIYYLRYTLKVI